MLFHLLCLTESNGGLSHYQCMNIIYRLNRHLTIPMPMHWVVYLFPDWNRLDHPGIASARSKLDRLKVLIKDWLGKHSATKHQLQCFIGHLSFAAKVVRPGRLFTWELINTMAIPKRSFHLVRLNSACRADIAWWALFLKDWNGISFFPSFPQGCTMESDASGKWGCGAFTSEDLRWFQVQWPKGWGNINIAIKELIPIVIGSGEEGGIVQE